MKIMRRLPVKKDFEKTCVDMHLHSEYSYDGGHKIESIMKTARQGGFGVAITDHDEIKGCLAAHRMKFKDVLLIPGVEITTKEQPHILIYGYTLNQLKDFWDKDLKKYKMKTSYKLNVRVEELIDLARSRGFFISAAHPYGPGKFGLMNLNPDRKLFRKFDALEIFNRFNIARNNDKALEMAKKQSLAMTAGTDSHFKFNLGKTLNCVGKADNAEDFLKQLKKKKNFVIGKESSLVNKFYTLFARQYHVLRKPGGLKIFKEQVKAFPILG
ncbi:PHP domain-containing protein [Nanoarchaeota archaeon]